MVSVCMGQNNGPIFNWSLFFRKTCKCNLVFRKFYKRFSSHSLRNNKNHVISNGWSSSTFSSWGPWILKCSFPKPLDWKEWIPELSFKVTRPDVTWYFHVDSSKDFVLSSSNTRESETTHPLYSIIYQRSNKIDFKSKYLL